MIFKINRVSDWRGEEKPCEKAKLVKPYNPQDPLGQGEWEIEINTLEELIALSDETNHALIVTDKEIEIYDDWRE